MRIPIREQLGLLVLFSCLVSVAVLAIATWIQNYQFVISIRSSGLSLTASLKAAQLSANLILFQTLVQGVSTRILIQSALQRYNSNRTTIDAISGNVSTDLKSALSGGGSTPLLLQATIFPKNSSGLSDSADLISVTGDAIIGLIPLPSKNANQTDVHLGDAQGGYPLSLYPNFTHTTTAINETYIVTNTFAGGVPLYSNSTLVLGPLMINETFSLISLTASINNNTSASDILGWLTVVINAKTMYDILQAPQGLAETGEVLLVGPNTPSNKFSPSLGPDEGNEASPNRDVKFVLPPPNNSTLGNRHNSRAHGTGNPVLPFPMTAFPAVERAYTSDDMSVDNAGSLISARNEENKSVSVGFARLPTTIVDWLLVFEQSHDEVFAPVNRLRKIVLACVFGTIGVILLCLFPVAHYAVRPIRQLRDATRKSIQPYLLADDSDHFRSTSRQSRLDENAYDRPDTGPNEKSDRRAGFFSWWRKKPEETTLDPSRRTFRIPGKVPQRKHWISDELTDLTSTFNEMSDELKMQYDRLEERVKDRTRELEQSKKAAEAANESKTLFIANISHELKTPLNGILGMCAVCMQEEDKTKIRRSLQIIYKSGDLLLHLLNDLLTFSKNSIGQQLTLDEKEFRVGDVSSQILSIFDKQAKEGQITLKTVFEGPNDALGNPAGSLEERLYGPHGTGRVEDMYLWGDQHRILQVVINFASNSLKFTPPGGTVEVRVRCVGLAREESATRSNSRDVSIHSRKSRQQSSGSYSKKRARISEDRPPSRSAPDRAGSPLKEPDSALIIQAEGETKKVSQVIERKRSRSPPPLNSKRLLFEFEVTDTGLGIPEDQQQKIFEPFVQGDLGLSKKYAGTGLGLSICAQLANLMGGRISLRSQTGVGSTFRIQIPLRFIKEAADSLSSSLKKRNSNANSVVGGPSSFDVTRSPHKNGSNTDVSTPANTSKTPSPIPLESEQPRLVGLSQPYFVNPIPPDSSLTKIDDIKRVTAEAAKNGQKVRVLVAEDNKVNQEVVLRMLKLEDVHDVTIAKDGFEALDLVRESMETNNRFSLIFMDIQMPNLDGIQSTKRIREIGFSAPIVALTAFAEDSNRQECMQSGMDFFLSKPIRRPALKQVLNKYCQPIPEEESEAGGPGAAEHTK